MIRFLPATLPLLLAAASLLAQAPAGSSPTVETSAPAEGHWQVHVELHVLAVPEKAAFALLPKMRDDAKMPEAWKALETMVASGTARILAAPGTQTQDGERVAIREGEDVRYPTEWEGPEILESKESRAQADSGKPSEPGKDFAISFPATTFETRFTGIELAAEPEVSEDGRRLTLKLSVAHTRLLAWDEFEAARLANGDKLLHKQPRFGVVEDRTDLTIASGDRVLLGMHRMPDQKAEKAEKAEMELFIFHAWITPGPAKGP